MVSVDEWRKDGETTVYRRQYEYDRVGNRTKLTKNDGGTSTVSVYQYNGLGRLASVAWPSPTPTDRYVYSYDANGNLEEKEEQTGRPGSWATEYTWTYYWDTQDRLIKVQKYDEPAEEYDVCVEYKYCPSCGGALSERIEYQSDREIVKSWLRYQYHGLNLLRIDEKYDTDGTAGLQSTDLWRVMNWYVHGPGSIGQTVRATAYSYNHNKTNSPCETNEYYYCYDALGNVNGVLQDGNYYRWETDAFGNDLPAGNDFLPMTSGGPKEHQTGKNYDTTTGLYYFHSRWYDPVAGRFVSRDPEQLSPEYSFCESAPLNWVDADGRFVWPFPPVGPILDVLRILQFLENIGFPHCFDLNVEIGGADCQRHPTEKKQHCALICAGGKIIGGIDYEDKGCPNRKKCTCMWCIEYEMKEDWKTPFWVPIKKFGCKCRCHLEVTDLKLRACIFMPKKR